MKYKVKCRQCSHSVFIRGIYEPDTNATVLNDNDRGWNDACEHMLDGNADWDILEEEPDEDIPDYGDSRYPH